MNNAETKKRLTNTSLEKLNSFQKGYSTTKPPVFKGFTEIPGNGNGFFIQNKEDQSIFKWINVDNLICNGIFYPKKSSKTIRSKGGRRNFGGDIFPNDLKTEYKETDDSNHIVLYSLLTFKAMANGKYFSYITISSGFLSFIKVYLDIKRLNFIHFSTSESFIEFIILF